MLSILYNTIQLAYVPTEIKNCFTVNSSVELSRETNTVCVNFEPSSNALCQDLPRGLNVSVTLSELADEVYDYVYDFNYSATRQFCFVCPECAGTTFFKSSYARVSLTSVAKTTSFTVGKIFRVQADYSKCFFESRFDPDEYYSQLAVEKHRLCFKAASTFRCTVLSKVYSVNSIKVSLQFSDREPLDFVYTGETVLNTYFTDAGAYPSSRPYSFYTVCFASADNIYNIFAFNNFQQAQITFNLSNNNVFRILSTKAHVFKFVNNEDNMNNFTLIPTTLEYQFRGMPNNNAILVQKFVEDNNILNATIKLIISSWNTAELKQTYYQYVDIYEIFNYSSPSNYITCFGVSDFDDCKKSIQQVRGMNTMNLRMSTQLYYYNNSDKDVLAVGQNIISSKINNCWNDLIGVVDNTGMTVLISYYNNTSCVFDERTDIILRINVENNTFEEYAGTILKTNLSFQTRQQEIRLSFNQTIADLILNTEYVMLQASNIEDTEILQELQFYNVTVKLTNQPIIEIVIYDALLLAGSLLVALFYAVCRSPLQQYFTSRRNARQHIKSIEKTLQSNIETQEVPP
ncbi:Conserved_hypothetical protein [Hexamita inflata]|uniref:Transmembrane protein n=1 Tax=Hexamita inflata TaxID=28002 RepID=A0ABP1IVD8_9EUKA